MKKAALIIMAAGLASRYGGNKQIDGMGPHGEILMEYSIYDAVRAGFTKVVLIVRTDMIETMKELVATHVHDRVDIRFAPQDLTMIPDWAELPEGRVKPLGTVHAVLCAKPYIDDDEPFAVINADDYYGVESYKQMYEFLRNDADAMTAAMMGYRLKRTVSRSGTVTRGLCQIEDNRLTSIREVKNIREAQDGTIYELNDESEPRTLAGDHPVSMNFWGFSPAVFGLLGTYMEAFLKGPAQTEPTAECLLPVFVDAMIRSGALTVRVLPTTADWFGVTYKEDRPKVAEALKALHEQGVYPNE